ncbi:MAG: hypothetical protein ACLPZR_00060 [Solirubrobacteraceae bacterium]
MIVFDEHRSEPDAQGGGGRVGNALSVEAAPHLKQLQGVLRSYRSSGRQAELEAGFVAARALVAELAPPASGQRPELEELRRLAREVPEFGELLSAAAGEAELAMRSGTGQLWDTLGLRSPSPCWTAAELEAARMVFACACAPGPTSSGARLQTSLRQLAANRFAGLLCMELTAGEQPWLLALADRYGSVRHRYARRTPWRSRGLAELIRSDETARRAVADRLERWIAAGGQPTTLADELEAALVHCRTPSHFA